MNSRVFFSMVKESFGYLVESYGFHIASEIYNPSIEAGQMDFDSSWVSIRVVRFLAPEMLRSLYDRPDKLSAEKDTALQLRQQAQILREYCEPILREGFAQWGELKQFGQSLVKDVLKEQE